MTSKEEKGGDNLSPPSQKKALLEKLEGERKPMLKAIKGELNDMIDNYAEQTEIRGFNAGLTRAKELVEEIFKG